MAEVKKIAEDNTVGDGRADPTDNNGTEGPNGTDRKEKSKGDEGKTPVASTVKKGDEGKTPVASPVKKVIGVKEVPPFVWKVVGRSGRTVLVLFKAIERVDAEAQLARLASDGYYKDLRLVDIDEKVVQPKPAKTRKSAAKSSGKPVKAVVAKSAKAKPAAKKKPETTKKPAAKKARAKGTAKATSKVVKKKTKSAPAKSAKKKAAKKK